MATRIRSRGENSEPTFSEVIGENAPYITAMYVLNLVLLVAFIDHGALLDGRLAYEPMVSQSVSQGIIPQMVAAGLAALFVMFTLLGVLFAISIVNDSRRDELDDWELEERIIVISIVPSLQLFAVILTPVLTRHSIVGGIEFLVSLLAALF
jgi:heme/copper-type cytochrome/quinol oxidase subunit 1